MRAFKDNGLKKASRMTPLAERRCYNHPRREAAVLCPGCHRFYCRECVAEHDDMMLCSTCINKTRRKGDVLKSRLVGFARTAQSIAGFLLLWLLFYYLGQALLSLPSSFHEGAVWKSLYSSVGPDRR